MRNCYKSLLIALSAFAVSCSADITGTQGDEFISEDQKMVIRHLTIKGGEIKHYNTYDNVFEKEDNTLHEFVQTRLYRSDSILSSNRDQAFIGVDRSDTFGIRTAALASTMMFMNALEEDGFGYRPIFDTMKLVLSVLTHDADTLTPVRYNIFELNKDLLGSVINEEDTTAYLNCDLTKAYDKSKPLFSFTFPDGEKTGPSTLLVPLEPAKKSDGSMADNTSEFIRKLMLIPDNYKSKDWDGWARDTLDLYVDEEVFMEHFKGLAVVPDDSSVKDNARGSLYGLELGTSGIYLTGRSRNPQDPTLIKDTVGMYYYFVDLTIGDNMSVTSLKHDYTRGLTSAAPLLSNYVFNDYDEQGNKIPREQRTLVSECFVEGAGGVLTELFFTDEFIEEVKSLRQYSLIEEYEKIAINQCSVKFYLPGADYVWENTQTNAEALVPLLNSSIKRLGAYDTIVYSPGTKYPTAIADYNFLSEKNYGTNLKYDGNLNRSKACYTMDISSYMQLLFNYVYSLKKEDGEGWEDFDDEAFNRAILLAPEVSNIYTSSRSRFQGMASATTTAPIQIDITYTLIK